MKEEMILRKEAMNFLIKKFGEVDAERFIASIKNEKFDYTKWRKENLFVGMSVEDIHNAAVKYMKTKKVL